MYVDINSTTYDAENNQVIIEGIDLDSVLLNDWTQEFSEDAEVRFSWDLTKKGHRIYLFKLLKSQVKEDCRSLAEMVGALRGITNISTNFMDRTAG